MPNRTEVDRTSGSIVDHRHKAMGPGEFDDCLMVRHLQQWICHRLNIDRLRVGTPFLLPRLRVIAIDEIVGYPECGEIFRDKVVGPTIQTVLNQKMIPAMEERE